MSVRGNRDKLPGVRISGGEVMGCKPIVGSAEETLAGRNDERLTGK